MTEMELRNLFKWVPRRRGTAYIRLRAGLTVTQPSSPKRKMVLEASNSNPLMSEQAKYTAMIDAD